MAAIDDLNSSVSSLQTTVDAVAIAVAALKTVPNNDASISAASASINDAVLKLNTVIQ